MINFDFNFETEYFTFTFQCKGYDNFFIIEEISYDCFLKKILEKNNIFFRDTQDVSDYYWHNIMSKFVSSISCLRDIEDTNLELVIIEDSYPVISLVNN
jgi:hypothetical protein